MEIEHLFCECVFSVHRKQMALLDWIGIRDWQFDRETSKLTFLPETRFETQVLGLETNDGEWIWAWADNGNHPTAAKRLAREIRDFGVEKEIAEFTIPKLATKTLQCGGHTLAVVAASQAADCPYFVCPGDHATLFVVITDPGYTTIPRLSTLVELATTFPQLFADYAVSDHRLAVISAFKKVGIVPELSEELIRGTQGDVTLICRFDEIGRLREVITQ